MNGDQLHDVEELAAYALGALDEGASRAVERHVAACPSCRAELADLQAVTALLSVVPVEAFEDSPVPPAENVPSADPAEPSRPVLAPGAQRGNSHHVLSIGQRDGPTGPTRRRRGGASDDR